MLSDGTYNAEAKSAVIWESEKGALMVTFDFDVEGGGNIKGQQCIVQKDGTISEISIRTLKECFGWAGQDPFDLENPDSLSGKKVELVLAWEEYNGKQRLGVKYINAPGGGMPKPADRKSVLAKYGAKFRALSGGAPAAPTKAPAAKTPPAPPKPPAPPAPNKSAAPPSTMEDAWANCCAAHQGKPEGELYELWNQATEKVKPGHTNDLTPEQWGEVKAMFEDNVPY